MVPTDYVLQYEWARHRTRGELLDLVLEIEDRLRRLVRGVLREAATERGEADWQQLIPDTIRNEIRVRKAWRGSEDLLDGATLAQLIDLALHHWKLFCDLLGEREQFRTRADAFRKWRNSLSHGKVPNDNEKVQIVNLVAEVGRHIAAPVETLYSPGGTVDGAAILWVDDRPEGNLRERRMLRMLGIEVVPVLSNDEAVELARQRTFDAVISDIDRQGAEPGNALPGRLRELGVSTPVLFYVGTYDPTLGRPPGAHSIHDDPATLIRDVLVLLTRLSSGSPAGERA